MTYAVGIDISRYNVSFDPNRATGPIDFVFQKVTEGETYVDLAMETLWPGVAKIGIRGAYHYQRSGVSWLSQADHYLNVAARHDYHLHILDLEEYGNAYNDTFFADTRRIIDRWRARVPSKRAVLYTNNNGYELLHAAITRLYGDGAQWMASLPLWLASPGTPGFPSLTPLRATWDVHQYTWKGSPGRWGTGGTAVDENVYHGTLAEMRQWVGLSSDPLPSSETRTLFGGALVQERRVFTSPRPIVCHISSIDTSKVSRYVITSPRSDGLFWLSRTSDFAISHGVDLAINGDEAYPSDTAGLYRLIRRHMADGVKYGLLTDGVTISVSKDRPYQRATVAGPFPDFAYNALSGSHWLVRDGALGPFEDTLPPDPRTLRGYNRDGTREYWVVVDGRSDDSRGMGLLEAARLMLSLGCWQAVNLDGGGSSTVVIKGEGVVNSPSDPAGERLVGNHIGVVFDFPTGGTMGLGQAKERLGKTPTIRSEPRAAAGNTIGTISAYGTVSFVRVVDDQDYPGDETRKWFDLTGDPSNPRFTNYIYPPNGQRFTILVQPDIPPEEPEPPTGSEVVDLHFQDGELVSVKKNGQELWTRPSQ